MGRLPRVGAADRSIAFLRKATSEHTDGIPFGMARLAGQIGLSERTLRRHCLAAFGYGVKTLQRIMRFQGFFNLAVRSGDQKLANLALEAGFADQCHLAREVRRLSGLTAGQFVAHIGL
jgi:AraC-like DNA-binding protein